MASPRILELKQGTKEPSMEEVKRCELKLPVEIKRTARIRCGGCVPPWHEAEGLQGGVARA
jgi:hypothetical protein